MTEDTIKRSDQIAMLESCAAFTKTGEWRGVFTYPGCGYDLVLLGLVTEDKKITRAGQFALTTMGAKLALDPGERLDPEDFPA